MITVNGIIGGTLHTHMYNRKPVKIIRSTPDVDGNVVIMYIDDNDESKCRYSLAPLSAIVTRLDFESERYRVLNKVNGRMYDLKDQVSEVLRDPEHYMLFDSYPLVVSPGELVSMIKLIYPDKPPKKVLSPPTYRGRRGRRIDN